MNNKILASLIAGLIYAILGLSWNILIILKSFGIGFVVTLVAMLLASISK